MTEVTIKPWVKRGQMLVNTSALEIKDPDHVYNQLLAQGVIPEEYGYEHPNVSEYEKFNRSQLIMQIIDLKEHLYSLYRHGM